MSHTLFPWRDAFLAALREVPVVQHACDMVGVQRCTVYRARKDDKEFAQAWDDAMEAGVDRAEREAFRRAVEGFEEPVVHKGRISWVYKPVTREDGSVDYVPVLDAQGQPVPLTVRKHSDALLSLVLKGRRKQVYAERTELTGANGAPIAMDDTARAARVEQLMAQARARRAAENQEPEDFA